MGGLKREDPAPQELYTDTRLRSRRISHAVGAQWASSDGKIRAARVIITGSRPDECLGLSGGEGIQTDDTIRKARLFQASKADARMCLQRCAPARGHVRGR
jgi:hypothetical protein